MKLSTSKFVISISFLIICIALPCEAEDLSQIYSTIKRPAIASEQIKLATDFFVRPIDFSSFNPLEIGYESRKDWEDESKDMPKEFSEAFPILLKKYNINNKKITIVIREEVIQKGIIVDTIVLKVIRNRGFISRRGVEFLCNIIFTDVESGKILFSGIANIESIDDERTMWPVHPFRNFTYHLETAAFNFAFVIIKIMVDGNMQQCDYRNCP